MNQEITSLFRVVRITISEATGALVVIVMLAVSFAFEKADASYLQSEEGEETADESSIQAALEYIRNGEIDQGAFILQRLAGQGNAESLYHMGELFRLGIGREKADGVAVMYFRLASTLGHKRASLSLANMLFFEGDSSEKTIAEALSVWQTLALEGDIESMYMLGMIYWNGEAGIGQDPVRGYGLVWRAAQAGYTDAVQNELTMRSLLNAEARDAAMKYGNSLDVAGFSDEPLALDLVVAEAEPDQAAEAGASDADTDGSEASGQETEATDGAELAQDDPVQDGETEKAVEVPLVKPDDWGSVWRLEVGFAMSEVEVRRLQSMINQTQQASVGKLFSDIQPSVTRPGLFRLIYGPLRGMHQAVNTCVSLKRAGHDCSARAPE